MKFDWSGIDLLYGRNILVQQLHPTRKKKKMTMMMMMKKKKMTMMMMKKKKKKKKKKIVHGKMMILKHDQLVVGLVE